METESQKKKQTNKHILSNHSLLTSTSNAVDQAVIVYDLAYHTNFLTGFSPPTFASMIFFTSVHISIKNINQLSFAYLEIFCWVMILFRVRSQLSTMASMTLLDLALA